MFALRRRDVIRLLGGAAAAWPLAARWPGFLNDVQITLFTWSPNGSLLPNVSVDWRCRLPAPVVIV